MSLQVPDWSATELDVMRVGVGLVVVLSIAKSQFFRPTGTPSHPVGIARVVDLTWVSSRVVARWIPYGAFAAALCYAAGLLVPYALAFLAVVVLIEVTYRSSFGSVNHGYHLMVVTLAALATSTVLWNAAARWDRDLGGFVADSQQATAAWWAVQAIVAVYLTSGLSKVINSRGQWIARSPGVLLTARVHADTFGVEGEALLGASVQSRHLVSWLFERPAVSRCLFAVGLLAELTAPVGFLGETALLVVGLALIALHQANARLLGLPFPEYQLLVLVFLVNVPQFFR